MNPHTIKFVQTKFKEHYKKDPPQPPPFLDQREWGFLMFDPVSGMNRHKYFSSDKEMQEYILAMVPAHIYYSAAYYQHPAAAMKDKTWLGADLIFDLDADHLPHPADSYQGMLDSVKKETIKLINFLIDDFGFEQENMHIAFSGGRGYHVHIRDERVLTLDSAQRREIIDYLNGTGLKKESFFKKEYIEGDDKTSKVLMFPSELQLGWGRLVNRALILYLKALVEEENVQEKLMEFKNIGKTKALKIIDTINNPYQLKLLRSGNFDALSSIPLQFWENAIHKVIQDLKVHIDEPVTSDIKRLIRAASSLHGKTGMKVVSLTLDELRHFEPLVDAVMFGDDEIKINAIRSTTIEMMDNRLQVDEGINVVPEYAAVYLMCKNEAEYMEDLI
jgi:DNA primase small subunit